MSQPEEPRPETPDEDEVLRCRECGAVCDFRIQWCECGSDCPNPPVQR